MINFNKYFLIACIGLMSCNSDDKIIAENKELRNEIAVLKDSIENLTASPDLNYLVEILQVDTSKGPLGNLHADTLVLTAHFSECGEFGGNREWIKIFRESNTPKCIIIRDSADCENYDYETRYTRIDSSLYVLDRKKESLIIHYLNELTKLSFMEQNPLANALNWYSAEVIYAHDVPSYVRPYYIAADDWSFLWPEFMKLRAGLKN